MDTQKNSIPGARPLDQFKKGDRVRMLANYSDLELGEEGVVLGVDTDGLAVSVEWDLAKHTRHDCDGRGRDKHCRWVFDEVLEILEYSEHSLDSILGL